MTSKNLLLAALLAAAGCASHPQTTPSSPNDASVSTTPTPPSTSSAHDPTAQANPAQGTTAPAGATTPRLPSGKPQAPVDVAATVQSGSAQVSVRFGQAATGVEIRAGAARGLTLQNAPVLVANATVSAGQVLTYQVPFTAAPNDSLLAINVHGIFAGGPRNTVRAFVVPGTSPVQPSREPGNGQTVNGSPVELVPGTVK